jgi:aryl-alcohol dehydrogenase-like predicted oxidoreductase
MIEKLAFGRSGHLSSRLIFGAAAFGQVTQAEADRTMELLLQFGINHIDTAASYGEAEIRLGPWMETHRSHFFLATKTGERRYAEARDSIQRSLERLRTSQIDLLQLHAVVEDDELEAVTAAGGALEAAVEARQAGLVRFIGITSHSLHAPAIHRMALARFDFDSVLLPYNYMLMQNEIYRVDFERLADLCREKNVAMQLIKTVQRRPWEDRSPWAATWYEPFAEPWAIDIAIRYALSRPGVFINTAGDIHVLPLILESASRFAVPPSLSEMEELVRHQQALPLWS